MHPPQSTERSPRTMEDKRRESAGVSPPPASMMEASPSDQPTSRRRGGGPKRKLTSVNSGGGSSTSQTTSSKRQAREKPSVVPFPPIHMNGPCTRARVQPFNSYSSSEVARLKSEVEAREAAAKAEEMTRLIGDWEALEAKIEAEYEAIRSRDVNIHVVPIHAGWFSWTQVHPLEERMLPLFFNGKSESRSPEIYMEIRNWIMKKFHFNPNMQIELEHLSELTVGELDARREVMEFLDYWGLINYHPFPHHESAAMIVDSDASKDESGKMETLVEKLFKFETVQSWTPTVAWLSMATPAMSSGLIPEPVIADELVKSEGPSVEYHCNSCAADCSRKRYHCQKQADFDLCAECYNDGKFGSDMSPSDFILMEPPEAGGASGGKWTDQETLLLLEAIELFKDNWSEIAEHVATKTKAQCILHFVEMPIEDAFFSHDENRDILKENGVSDSSSAKNSDPKTEQESDTAPKKESVTAPKNELEKTECQGGSNDNQESSCPMEISKANEVNQSNLGQESFALKALKEAFEAVGSFPSPGGRLSFAEAGNPVMTLAAFLVRLVEPNIVNASIRSLLKSLSSSYASEHLAARHSFPLEDPPDDKKNMAVIERSATEKIPHEAKINSDRQAVKQEEMPDPIVDGIDLRDDQNDRINDSTPEECDEREISASKDQSKVASSRKDCVNKSVNVKEADVMTSRKESQPALESELSSSDKGKTPNDAEESVSASHTELQSNMLKGSEHGSANVEGSQSTEPLKEEDTVPISEKKDADALVMSNSIAEKENNAGDREAKECGTKKQDLLSSKNSFDINSKLKQAAVTALSAAAVKAKLLADQEEDQILQLSAFLIEKQLYKLETKLAFFNEMENAAMRVKEQLDRSKQRLFHERAQIIATRFGMSGPARPTSQNLPPNRAAVGFPNAASKLYTGMNSLRPPISRPMGPSSSPSNTFPTGTAMRSSMQTNADKLSSVGMK